MRNKKINQLYAKKTPKTIEYRPQSKQKRSLKSILLNTLAVVICVPIILFSGFLVVNFFSMNTSRSAHSERANNYVRQILDGKALQRNDIIEFQPTSFQQEGGYYASSGTRRDYSGSFTYVLINDDNEYYYLALHVIPNFVERDYAIEVLVATDDVDSLRDDIREDMIQKGYVN